MDGGGHHPLRVFSRDARLTFRWDELGQEIMGIAVPGALALMADPVASLVDTAFIGHIGSVELAAVGISIAVFNQVSRIAIFPLVSVTTSFVAEEDASFNARNSNRINEYNGHNVSESEMEELISPGVSEASATDSKSSTEQEVNSQNKRKQIPSVSTALLLGTAGIIPSMTSILVTFVLYRFLIDPYNLVFKPHHDSLTMKEVARCIPLHALKWGYGPESHCRTSLNKYNSQVHGHGGCASAICMFMALDDYGICARTGSVFFSKDKYTC